MLQKFIDEANKQVANHSIYVWGASGQYCKDINEKWIRAKESRNEGGKHADAAIKSWRVVMASPFKNVARCFDCSGFVSHCLMQAGALDKRHDCDGLYALSEPTNKLEDGTLLFRVNKNNPNDETHVGIYIGGKQYHSKGRSDGVVAESYNASFWAKKAWFKALPHTASVQTDPVPEPQTPQPTSGNIEVIGGSVYVRKSDHILSLPLFIAHRGESYTYLGTADSGWYKIKTSYGIGYISNKPHLTKLHLDNEAPAPQPISHKVVQVIGGSVYVRSKWNKSGAIIGTAHAGDMLPYVETAESGWYCVEYMGKRAYISNKPTLTKLKEI